MKRLALLTGVACLALLLAACDGQSDQSGVSPRDSESVADVSRAILDWEEATIQFPLDAYGMSLPEQHRVMAALSVVFARCVTGTDTVSESVVNEAKKSLVPMSPDPFAAHWLFGVWDAPYVAKHGWKPFSEDPPHPLYVAADPATTERCISADDYSGLRMISANTLEGQQTDLLANLSGDSYMQTVADSRYALLIDQLQACGEVQGYQALPLSSGGGFVISSQWSNEEILKTKIAEAQCNDQLSLTQVAGDIMAAFQLEAIRDHEAELLAIKQVANERVALAEQILQEIGAL